MACIHLQEGADYSRGGGMCEFCALSGETDPDCENCDQYEDGGEE